MIPGKRIITFESILYEWWRRILIRQSELWPFGQSGSITRHHYRLSVAWRMWRVIRQYVARSVKESFVVSYTTFKNTIVPQSHNSHIQKYYLANFQSSKLCRIFSDIRMILTILVTHLVIIRVWPLVLVPWVTPCHPVTEGGGGVPGELGPDIIRRVQHSQGLMDHTVSRF